MDLVNREIYKLQTNLQAIRKVAGWTTQDLGDLIGVTKQTISNLENRRTKMTKTQYIALRSVIDYEIATHEDRETLAIIVKTLLDSGDEADEKHEAIKTKSDKKNRTKAAVAAGALIQAAVSDPVLVGITGEWMAKIIAKKVIK